MSYRKVTNKKYSFRQYLFVAGFLAMIFTIWASPAAAQYQCTDAVYFTSTANTNIYRFTPSTTAVTQVTGASILAGSAGSAVTPGGTRLYSIDNATPFSLHYNAGGTTNGTAAAVFAGASTQRNAIAPNGTGYAMVGTAALAGQYYTYTTGGTTSTVSGPFNLTLQPSTAPTFVNGGDIAFDANGIGYLIDQGKNFYRLDFTANTATFLGTFTGMGTDSPNGLGFTSVNTAGQNFLYASTLTTNRLYRLDIADMTATLLTPSNTVAGFTQNDIASCIYPPGIVPNMAVTKAWRNVTKGDPATFATSTAANIGDVIEYRVIVRNTGVIASGNTTFVDTLQSGLTYVNNSTTLNTVAVSDLGGTGNTRFPYRTAENINSASQPAESGVISVDSTPTVTTDNEATIVFRATVTNPFSSTVSTIPNTATVNFAGASSAVNSNTVNTPVLAPELTISKNHTGSFTRGTTSPYTFTVTNDGTAPTSGTITVSDTLPANFTVNGGLIGSVTLSGANAANWSCSSNLLTPQTVTCTSNTVLSNVAGSNTSVFSFSPFVSILASSNVTNTATVSGGNEPTLYNGNNSSSDPTTVVSNYSLTGNIFEDTGYTGGAGRNFASSGGTGVGGARVELYSANGTYLGVTLSNSNGQYQFPALLPGNYIVRVVNSTVNSTRAGSIPALIGVQTFRTNNGADDVNRVGGEDPTEVDADANTLLGLLSALMGSSTTPQSLSPVTITSADITGVDFGYNFDTIVNVNNSGQGSLRQFITNSNTLTGADKTIFMIPNGTSRPGLRAGLTNQLTNGVAAIAVSNSLPAITDSNTTIDGTTQTTNVGNTNSGTFGTGGTVGIDGLALSTVQRPEVQISTTNAAIGLDLQGANSTVRGISIYGFGSTPNSNNNANIRIGALASNALIEQNLIGTTATAFADPGNGTRSGGDNVRAVDAANGILRNNLIGFSAGKGFGVEAGSTGWLIENNEISGNGIGNANLDGVDLESAGTTNNTVRGNLVYNNEGVGVDSYNSGGSNTVINNTITGNGAGGASNAETAGVRMFGAGNVISLNKIYANYGAGVMIAPGASANTISRNSIYANGTILTKSGGAASGQIGIDLLSASDNVSTGTAPYVTLNDSGDGDSGGNGLLNFPVLENAQIFNGNLILTGFARPGSTIEFFVAAPDASGFGEGQTYITTLTEGSAQDTDVTTGTYTSPLNGKTVGTDTTNRFSFSISLPAGVSSGTVITSTATLSGATSEFSNNVTLNTAPPAIRLVKSVSPTGTQMPGTDLTYTISFTNTGGQAATNFALTDPNPANTTLKLNTNTDFKLGSVTNTLGTTGLTATVTYSNDGGATFAYTPVSAGGGADTGYDRNVTHVRWAFAGSLSQTAPNNTGSVSFIVKIR